MTSLPMSPPPMVPDALAPLHAAVREALTLYAKLQQDQVTARAAFGLAVAHIHKAGDVDLRTAVFLLELEISPLGT